MRGTYKIFGKNFLQTCEGKRHGRTIFLKGVEHNNKNISLRMHDVVSVVRSHRHTHFTDTFDDYLSCQSQFQHLRY